MMDWIDHRMLELAVAGGLGLLVGLQREWVSNKRIGLRSFALISTLGGVIGLLAPTHGEWLLAAGFLAITVAIFGHAYLVSRHSEVTGMTTELAAMLMFLVGALATSGYMGPAVVLGGAITLLLHWKAPLHTLTDRIGETEFRAIARFVLITLVVLPVLPDQTFGPYGVLNPRGIWLMVVLIVSLNLAGYLAQKLSSGRSGALVSGVLGGLISSTVTTVSFATRSRDNVVLVPLAAIVILTASALVYVRILIETLAVASSLLPALIWPALAYVLLFAIAVGVYLARFEPAGERVPDSKNPAELKSALSFGALYVLVLVISAAASEHLGDTSLYGVAVVSGLTDVDAITLSTARLYADSRIGTDTAWRVIFLASVSNLAFKAGVVAVLSGPALRRRLLPTLAGLVVVGVLMTAYWP